MRTGAQPGAGVRVCLYGGTFDPIHQAHLRVAAEAVARCHLQRVLVIPAGDPPHKPAAAVSYAHRLRMVELACAGHPSLIASNLEEAGGKSYSIQTIRRVRASLSPADELYFLIGADAFAEITTWYQWQDVLREVTFLVVSRPGHAYSIPAGARVERLDQLALPVSSSEVRAQLARRQWSSDLPRPVMEYIAGQCLYGFC